MTYDETLIKPVITKHELTLKVEHLVRHDSLTYIESVLEICNEYDIDPEDIGKLVAGPLKDKLEAEAQRNKGIAQTGNTASLFDF